MATPLILGGLAVALAFRAGLFNIGAEGRSSSDRSSRPTSVSRSTCPGSSTFRSPCWELFVGGGPSGAASPVSQSQDRGSRSHHDDHAELDRHLPGRVAADPNPRSCARGARPDQFAGELRRGYPTIVDQWRVHAGIIVAVLCAAGVAWLLNRSTLGFQFRAVGANPVRPAPQG